MQDRFRECCRVLLWYRTGYKDAVESYWDTGQATRMIQGCCRYRTGSENASGMLQGYRTEAEDSTGVFTGIQERLGLL